MNRRGDTIREQVRDIAKDYEIYGGFCLQVIRDRAGRIAEVYYLDMRFVRMNKDCNVFWYSEKWGTGRSVKAQTYPAFMPGLESRWAELDEDARNYHAASILFVKNVHTQTYPAPLYAASVKDCEIERNITDFHLNSLENGFVSSLIVNFNNGIPTDEIKEEIENAFNEKFSGHQNAGRIMFSWNKNKESATDIVEPKIEDFGERYKALSTHSRQQIFAAFRAVPALFGIMTESTGFNEQEFAQAFKLYNRTQVRPVQRLIGDAYERIYGIPEPLTIVPFSIESNTETTVQ
jgi:capsid portal protein